MPEVKSDIPVALRPFTFFGVEVNHDPQKDQATATCPFCEREGKFYINTQSGQFDCKVCGESGNVFTFLKRTWEESDWIEGEAEELAQDRRLSVNTLNKWELRIHDLTEDWIVAGYNAEGRVSNLYRRTWNHLEKRFYWQGPKGINQALFGMPLWDQSKDDVFLCYAQDTEILTDRGWVPFQDLSETDKVAAYAQNGRINFETPKARQVFDYNGDMIHFKSRWSDLVVTPEHRVLWKRANQRMKVSQARELGSHIQLPTTGLLTESNAERYPSEDEVRLLVAFVADGCIRRGYDLEFVFSKHRKMERLESLLKSTETPYRKTSYPSSPDKVSFLIDRREAPIFLEFCPEKTWTEDILSWPLSVRHALIEELRYWDGDEGSNSSRYFTSKSTEADLISRLAAITGFGCGVETKKDGTEFVVNLNVNPWRLLVDRPSRVKYQGKVYCVTVSTGFIVVRRNGKTIVSGNCEGLWDAMALWELLTTCKQADHEGKFLPTSNPELALYSNANVLAVPSANVFNEYWTPLFAGKRVYLCYDNDHPAKKTGIAGALEGMKRVANILFKSADPPKEVHYIKWGDGTTKTGLVGYDTQRKHGFDLRDLLTSSDSQQERRNSLKDLFSMFEPVPPWWVEGAKGSKGKPVIGTLECKTYAEVLEACKKAIVITPQMERGLANMLAVAALVPCGGDQLWMKFIGPPSSGKTTLADGLILARKYATMKSITTGLHSGYREKEDDGDYSLMNAIKDMAVIVKDGDTLLKAENVARILSELRDAYDRNSSTHFRNKVQREYLNHSFALLIFGTERMKELDQSELGQRFIDCVMMDDIDINHERETNLHIGRRLRSLFSVQMSLNGEGTEGREMMGAKQMIGGFLEHLRRNILYLFSEIRCSDAMLEKFDLIAQFVAYFRSRPSSMQNAEADTRELSHRLYQQFCKLAYGLCCVLGKKDVDDEVIARVAQCGLDTARGNTTKIAKALAESFKRTKVTEGKGKHKKNRIVTTEGLDLTTLSTRINLETRELKKLLIFMRGIKAVETDVPKNKVGVGSRLLRWRLTLHTKKLYDAIHSMVLYDTSTIKKGK